VSLGFFLRKKRKNCKNLWCIFFIPQDKKKQGSSKKIIDDQCEFRLWLCVSRIFLVLQKNRCKKRQNEVFHSSFNVRVFFSFFADILPNKNKEAGKKHVAKKNMNHKHLHPAPHFLFFSLIPVLLLNALATWKKWAYPGPAPQSPCAL